MVIGGHSNAFQSQEEVRTKSAFERRKEVKNIEISFINTQDLITRGSYIMAVFLDLSLAYYYSTNEEENEEVRFFVVGVFWRGRWRRKTLERVLQFPEEGDRFGRTMSNIRTRMAKSVPIFVFASFLKLSSFLSSFFMSSMDLSFERLASIWAVWICPKSVGEAPSEKAVDGYDGDERYD